MEKISVDLLSPENETILNPRFPVEAQNKLFELAEAFPEIEGHIWLTTSGSTSGPKLVALSKEALMVSAESVNKHLAAAKSDRWLAPLPLHHVGGLSIIARAEAIGGEWFPLPTWNPIGFAEACTRNQITLTSLVPTQLYDLLSLDIVAPSSLRAVIIGGGRLSERLFQRARELQWPVLPSFGSTEAGSQIATAKVSSLEDHSYPSMYLLPHLSASLNDEGRLSIRGNSLFTGYASYVDGKPFFTDPKESGSFLSEDIVTLHETWGGTIVTPRGRISDSVKISGELISVSHLNEILEDLLEQEDLRGQAYLIAVSDPRLENRIALVGVCTTHELFQIRDKFSDLVLPVARAREVYRIAQIPRSSLGKPLFSEIQGLLRDGKATKLYPV